MIIKDSYLKWFTLCGHFCQLSRLQSGYLGYQKIKIFPLFLINELQITYKDIIQDPFIVNPAETYSCNAPKNSYSRPACVV